MTSVFDDGQKAATAVQEPSKVILPVQSEAQKNPVVQVRTETAVEVITDQQIDSLGDQSSSQMSAISHTLLSQVRASDADVLGQKLNELIGVAKGLDPTKFQRKGILGFVANLFGNAKEKILAELQSIDGRMQVLIGELDRSVLLHDGRINDLENMYNANVAAHNELESAAKEGERMLGVLNVHLANEQQAKDAFAAQRIHDIKERIDRLEKRIDDNKRAMLLAKQAAPEIRLLQSCARDLSNQFKNVKAVTIPAWKNALTLYLIQLEQKKGAQLANAAHVATDEAFRIQADQLRQNVQEIGRAKQRSIVSMETLQHVQQQLIGSFDDMSRIAEEGRRARKEAEPKLVALEQELIARFTNKSI